MTPWASLQGHTSLRSSAKGDIRRILPEAGLSRKRASRPGEHWGAQPAGTPVAGHGLSPAVCRDDRPPLLAAAPAAGGRGASGHGAGLRLSARGDGGGLRARRAHGLCLAAARGHPLRAAPAGAGGAAARGGARPGRRTPHRAARGRGLERHPGPWRSRAACGWGRWCASAGTARWPWRWPSGCVAAWRSGRWSGAWTGGVGALRPSGAPRLARAAADRSARTSAPAPLAGPGPDPRHQAHE